MARKKKKSEDDDERITYKEPGEVAGEVVLKGGNQEGLSAIVRITEEVKVEQDHDANITSIGFNGSLSVENPSTVDRLWDIGVTFKDVDAINLESNEILIKELGVTEDDNVEAQEFQLSGDINNLLLIKEYINTLPEADNILNRNDIESDLLTLKGKESDVDAGSVEVDDDDDDEYDASAEYSLESYGISINQLNTVSFVIALHSLFDKPITDVVITKHISDAFENIKILDSSIGKAELESDKLVWSIDELDPENTVIVNFRADITVDSKEAVKTGIIEVSYKAASSFSGGLEIETFDAYTNNKHFVDIIERDEEPGVWDCNLVFENPSEFTIEVFNIDAYPAEDEDSKFIVIDEDSFPILPAGAEWHSDIWQYENDDYPSFRKQIDFRVLAKMMTDVNSSMIIDDVELMLSSITGEVTLEQPEVVGIPLEEDKIILPSYKENEIPTTLKYVNDGSGPLNDVKLSQKGFDDNFKPPTPDEVQLFVNGKEVPLDPDEVIIDDDSITVDLKDLKDKPQGMLEPDSVIEVKYPIHVDSPPKDVEFVTDVVYNGNTFPLGPELEYIPDPAEIPVILVVHIRRKYRILKDIAGIKSLGNYQITLSYTNLGTFPLHNFALIDKVPDNFEYGEFSAEPEITDEVGSDTLKWEVELLEVDDKIEITYEINGSGEYRPSDAQLAF